ncbi:MAG: threonylcarbamoyl-AMP synthase [Armatimonadetes bacterium]|jgi:L-threonylcarbamoyladenylate synthase|nr:threonylcarbamoyl-AMP synthase [Armatimonadota bacterium]
MIKIKVNPDNPEPTAIQAAVEALRRGELIIFPTETVYGLAADAFNESAVRAVYAAKGRLNNQPLPVQVGDIEDVSKAAEYMSAEARRLAVLYWPGPLTMILPKAAGLSDLITCGGSTVGLRIPDHPVALALLREFGSVMVATSANKTGDMPPTTASQAADGVGESVTMILDGGTSESGIASTVVDLTVSPPKILRMGGIGSEAIGKVLGEVE